MIDWKGKYVLVTGGTGFIGSVLVEELLGRGARVRVPIRAENYRALSKLRAQIEWVDGDLRSAEYCASLVSGVNHVFHLASHRRNVDFHRKHAADVLVGNVEMTVALMRAIKENKHAGVTFFSSANVPPEIDVIRLAQQDTTDGYVLGKAMCEACWITAAKQYKFPLLIVRPVGVYGERDTFTSESNMIPALMVKASESKDSLDVWGTGNQERVFLYVHDLINALFQLLDAGADGIQYITPPKPVSVAEVAGMIRDLVNPSLTLKFDTSKPEGKRSLAMLPLHASLKGFPWTPLAEGLRRTYEGWKAKGK